MKSFLISKNSKLAILVLITIPIFLINTEKIEVKNPSLMVPSVIPITRSV